MDPNQAPEVVPYSNLEHYNQDHSTYSNYQNNNKSTAPLTDSTPYVPKKRKIAGLAPTTFWLLIALAVVTIAAAVGGGVGGSMAVANAKKSNDRTPTVESTTCVNSTATNTSDPSTPYRVVSGAMLPLDCEKSGEILAFEWGGGAAIRNFELTCNATRHDGDGAGVRSYLLKDCLTACVKMNSLAGSTVCTAAAFDTNLLSDGGTNCFLKNVTIAKKDVVAQKGSVLAVFRPPAT